ncbi:MAG: histidine kinase, partial [Ignavibacteriaceae bacterium]|nr:histidine kinase [Ignavibacteriaceae bacterium]
KSTEYHIESFKIFSTQQMYNELSDAYGEYGYQLKRRDLSKAVAYMQEALNIANEHNFPESSMGKLFDNYGVLKEMESNADSALLFYKKALEIKQKNKDNVGIPYSLNKIAVLKAAQGKFSEARKYLSLSDEYRSKESGEFGRLENLSIHADFLKMQGRIDDAINAYEKCQKIADSLDYNYMVLYCYQNLTELYKQKNNLYKALDTYQKYSAYKDSIINLETNEKIAQLEIAYETEQKNLQIKESQYKLNNRNQLLIFALVVVILLLLLSIGIYRYQQLKRVKIVKEIEFKSQLKNTELEKELAEEKLNISRELHDNIGSQLTFIISSLDNLTYSPQKEDVYQRLNVLKSFSKDALYDLRNTIWAMKQEEGDSEKLIIKLNEMIQKLNASLSSVKISFQNNFSGHIELSSIQILNLLRIVQEAIQNALKYSGGSKIDIIFNNYEKGLEVIIKDNGKGFDVNQNFEGNGLSNMKSRCEKASAELSISSNENGTTIVCRLKCFQDESKTITTSALLS